MPDLILIDGGKGQLSAVVKILKWLKLDLTTISIAKKEEEILAKLVDRAQCLMVQAENPVEFAELIMRQIG